MKYLLLMVGLLLLPGVLLAEDYFQPIPMAEVARIKDKAGVSVLDVNLQEVWEKHHLSGAVHIDGPELAKFLPADKKALLIFYCAGPLCEAGGLAANESVLLGFRQVYLMTDGIFGWVKAGYPVESAAGAKNAPAVNHPDRGTHDHHM